MWRRRSHDHGSSATITTLKSLGLITVTAICLAAAVVPALVAGQSGRASPIYGVTVPEGYRQWQMIGVAEEAEPLNELRAVLGNATAIDAYRTKQLPFPDGTVLVKLAWKRMQSTEFEPASVPGAVTTVQVMVKDANKYAATGGWGFGRFVNGEPVDEVQHQTCFACHQARVTGHDYVFTRYAP